MSLGRQQVFRLRRAFEADGPSALASRKRGRPSNRRHGEALRRPILALVRERYADFGPTLAAEKLTGCHGLRIGVETLRQWMIADGLWTDRRHRLPSPHQPRRRRDCLGELVQIDGYEHAWFEDRGATCTLLAVVDDATSRLMQLRFVTLASSTLNRRTTGARPRRFTVQTAVSCGDLTTILTTGRDLRHDRGRTDGTLRDWRPDNDLEPSLANRQTVPGKGTTSSRRD